MGSGGRQARRPPFLTPGAVCPPPPPPPAGGGGRGGGIHLPDRNRVCGIVNPGSPVVRIRFRHCVFDTLIRMTRNRGRWRGCAAPDPASAARSAILLAPS